MRRNGSNRRTMLMIVNLVFLLGLAGSTGYFFMKNRDLNKQLSMTEQERQRIRNDKYKVDISKLFTLPEEEPFYEISVVDPEEAIAGSPELATLFNDIKKNDFILVYKDAKLAIQYRPNENKIIKTSTVRLPIIVELVGEQADIDSVVGKLTEFGSLISIVKTVKEGVTQSFVFDVDDNQKADVSEIANQIGFEVGSTLPSSISPDTQTEIVISVSSKTTTE